MAFSWKVAFMGLPDLSVESEDRPVVSGTRRQHLAVHVRRVAINDQWQSPAASGLHEGSVVLTFRKAMKGQ
jgi:hypothetical protein